MPGSIVFRPIEANLTHNTELIGKMDPYVQFVLGTHKLRTNVCKKGGKHPMWDDSVTVPSTFDNQTCLVEIKDKDLLKDDRIGSFELNLGEIEAQGSVKKWFPIFHKDKPAGEILMEAVFSADSGFGQQGFGNQMSQPLGTGLGGAGLGTGLGSGFIAPTANYTAPLGQGGMMGSVPLQTQGATPNPGSKSLAEQFAEEALLRGIDPLHSHSANLTGQQPTGTLPTAFPVSSISGQERNLPVSGGMGGGFQGLSQGLGQGLSQGFGQGFSGQSGLLGQPHGGLSQGISNVPLGQTGLLPAQGGFIGGAGGLGGNIAQQASNAIHTVKDQHSIPMQHNQFTPVGTGIGSDYLTNNVVASNMGGTGHHVHHDQKTFGHGHHEPMNIVKEGLNPTTQGPKGTANMETFDRKVQHF